MTPNGDTPAAGANGGASGHGDDQEIDAVSSEPEPDALAVLEAEKIDLKDRLMRALADMENLRRRSEREAADARTYAITGFARDMLTVADNIRRALDSVSRTDGVPEEALRPFVEGVELTERDLLSILNRNGVRRLEPKGQKFDPNMHQAMFEVPNEELPSGQVVEVIQTGYAIGDRVLRPALVGVAKGGPKAG